MALCSGRTKRARLSFPDSFSLVHLPSASSQMLARICNPCSGVLLGSFGGAKEMNVIQKNKRGCLLEILTAMPSRFRGRRRIDDPEEIGRGARRSQNQ